MERDYVIVEIRRVAEEIGKSPGIVAFQKLSGIPKKDILGKLWARWSDALADAGLSANSFGSKRYDDGEVLNAISQVAFEINRWPSPNDLRMYAHANDGFMSETTIRNHFPKRSQLVEAMRKLAVDNDPTGQILGWLPEPTVSLESIQKSNESAGYVYLMSSGDFYKIGRSNEIERRVKQISVALPNRINLEHTIATDDPSGIEAYWHRRFAEKRANGEWFKLTKSDVLAFKKRKQQ